MNNLENVDNFYLDVVNRVQTHPGWNTINIREALSIVRAHGLIQIKNNVITTLENQKTNLTSQNSVQRATIDRLQSELNEFKKNLEEEKKSTSLKSDEIAILSDKNKGLSAEVKILTKNNLDIELAVGNITSLLSNLFTPKKNGPEIENEEKVNKPDFNAEQVEENQNDL
ncbi:hypothetical protein ACTFIW_008498 [Dictyostelium discoideum]